MKLEHAARQALVVLEGVLWTGDTQVLDYTAPLAITALREALDHSGKSNDMVGCAYCNNPLFAGTKCNNCGLVTLAEQAKQERMPITEPVVPWLSHKVAEQVEQEPVAWAPIITFRDAQHYLVSKQKTPEYCNPLYAAPVRTKDLTDDEIADLMLKFDMDDDVGFARAVIAADRSKNGTA